MGFIVTISSFSVVLTPIIFKRMRTLLFLRIIAIISFCDTIVGITYIMDLGRPLNNLGNSKLCVVQGALNVFFANAGLWWSVCLSIQTYSMVKYLRPYFREHIMHVVFWGIPFILEFVPLFSGSNYGSDDFYPEWTLVNACNLKQANGAPSVVNLITLKITDQIFKYVAIAIIAIFYFLTKREVDLGNRDPVFYGVTKIMGLYPFIFCICWLPWNLFYSSLIVIDRKGGLVDPRAQLVGNTIVNVIMNSVGFFVATIYFTSSTEARKKWHALLTKCTTNYDESIESQIYIEASVSVTAGRPTSLEESGVQLSDVTQRITVFDNDFDIDVEGAYVRATVATNNPIAAASNTNTNTNTREVGSQYAVNRDTRGLSVAPIINRKRGQSAVELSKSQSSGSASYSSDGAQDHLSSVGSSYQKREGGSISNGSK